MAIALHQNFQNGIDSNTQSLSNGYKQDIDVNRLKQCGTPRYLSPELLEGPMDVHNFADAFRQGESRTVKVYLSIILFQRMFIP